MPTNVFKDVTWFEINEEIEINHPEASTEENSMFVNLCDYGLSLTKLYQNGNGIIRDKLCSKRSFNTS